MMLHTSTQQLIRKLCELTEAGAIGWKEGDGGRVVFDTEGYVVEIQPDPPGIRLLRADGQELESADAADLATPWPEGEGTYATHIVEMARHASRIARGAETAIAKILSSLSAPPKRQPEPEPEPAALAFAATPAKPAPSVSAGESAAAIAAVNADLESQRRKAAEDPPVSHSTPQAPIAATAPETETAIDRVLAVQPAPRPEPVTAPEPPPVAKAEPPPAPKPQPVIHSPATPVISPRAIDLPPPFADATMQPQFKRETVAPIAAATPQPKPQPVIAAPPPPKPEPVAAAVPPAPRPEPIAAAAPAPKSGFGSIDGFSRAKPAPQPAPAKPEPKAEPAKITSGGLLVTGISARSRQTVESTSAQDIFRPAPAAAPAPQPAPPVEKKLEPATGADVYKPWA
jgi:hypothetical protein